MDIQLMLKLLRTLEQLRQHERWTRAQLDTYQAESLRRLREYAYARSPFYQKFHKGLFDRPLNELPVLTKAMMMEHFDELVTDRSCAWKRCAPTRRKGKLASATGTLIGSMPPRAAAASRASSFLTRPSGFTSWPPSPAARNGQGCGSTSPIVNAWRRWPRSAPGICPRRWPPA